MTVALLAVDSVYISMAAFGRMEMMCVALGFWSMAAYLTLREKHFRTMSIFCPTMASSYPRNNGTGAEPTSASWQPSPVSETGGLGNLETCRMVTPRNRRDERWVLVKSESGTGVSPVRGCTGGTPVPPNFKLYQYLITDSCIGHATLRANVARIRTRFP